MLLLKKLLSNAIVLVVLFGLTLAGCDTASDDGTQSRLTIQFQSVASSGSGGTSANLDRRQNDTLTVSGSNGKLVLTDIRFIVEDFELERTEGACDDSTATNEEECEEFESNPLFVDLPLQGDTLELGTAPIEPGLYEELEFEMDDLDPGDEEDPQERQIKEDLLQEIRQIFPDWPDTVSVVAIGSFVSSQGDTTDFRTFAKGEVEIEMAFSPPLEVQDNTVNKLIRVNISPADWFLRGDGTVVDLSQFDFDRTGQIYEFEVEIENGFKSIEIDDSSEDDSE